MQTLQREGGVLCWRAAEQGGWGGASTGHGGRGDPRGEGDHLMQPLQASPLKGGVGVGEPLESSE